MMRWIYLLSLLLSLSACFPDSQTIDPAQAIQPGQPGQTRNGQQTAGANDTTGIKQQDYGQDRVIWQKPEMILELLGDLRGKTVADIGAGTGFFALRMAAKADKVIAIDIDRRFVDYLDSIKVLELPEDIQPRLETRLALPTDPLLKPGEVDAILIVNTFMYIQDKIGYLRTLKQALREGGSLLIVDFKKKRTPIGPPQDLRIPLFEVEELMYKAGYQHIETIDSKLDYQYIIVAQR